jgi:4-amino-4-deoxy-L-arabinose transferase-like glycosyltransferase
LIKWLFPISLVLFAVLYPFAFFHAPIYADDAWLGQQVNSLLIHGKVCSNLFKDLPPLDGEVVVYHKLLIWSGAFVCKFIGWGLYQLRVINTLCAVLTLVLIYVFPLPGDSKLIRKGTITVLLFTPLFWNMQFIFRPEMLIMLLGFASFLTLMRARDRGNLLLYAFSGALAGLAGLAHPLGLAFMAAAFLLLVVERRFLGALIHLAAALLFFFPYVSGYFTNRELFMAQLLDNPMMLAKPFEHWWQPLLNVLDEHKRLFRKAEVIGLSTLFLLSLLGMNRLEWRRERPVLLYLAVLIVIISIPPFPKMTQYMPPLIPFFALIVARVLVGESRPSGPWRRWLSGLRYLWVGIFIAYGAGAMLYASFIDRSSQLQTNELIASGTRDEAVVMAPVDFVFPADDRLTVISWCGATIAAGNQRSPEFLDNYAAGIGVDYIVASTKRLNQWGLNGDSVGRAFKSYRLELALEDQGRYLLKRVR